MAITLTEGQSKRLDASLIPIEVVIKGDFNGDGFIDEADRIAFNDCYGSELGDDNYNPIGDFNDDGIIDIYDFAQFSAVYEPLHQTYTLGVYYFYLEGSEGSSDTYAWHDNWEEWCRWIVEYKANLLANYCDGNMPIEFVKKHGISTVGSLSKLAMAGIIKKLSGYNDVDLCIVVWESNLHAGFKAYPGLHTVLVQGLKEELDIKGMKGEDYSISCVFNHEIAHLFKLDHCTNLPCVMAQPILSYADWINQGKQLYFCDEHKSQLLKNWEERNYY